ncbi:VWA domain-containing protein [Nocardioides ochotonae]|uniref:VWA domain-containing protein n=1 Tax=Nocardioides ochotonae TaxID=2685869 RepID=UPI001408F11D|nr:VWA domain-containing protein [Nocardioides ochotonae]
MSVQPVWPVLVLAAVALVLSCWSLRDWRSSSGMQRGALAARVVLALLAVGIGLRPTGLHEVEVPVPSTTDLVLLVDRTASMGALDGPAGRARIEAAGEDLAELVQQTAGANTTVIVFDDVARVAVPFTTDAAAVSTYLRTVGWRPSAKATGSDISVAVELAEQVLRSARAEHPEHQRYLVYAGDGEQTQDGAPGSFGSLREGLTGSLVLGYGTAEGGAMPVAPGEQRLVEIEGEEQVSRIDGAALSRIAEELGGQYLHRTGPGSLPTLTRGPTSARVELQPGEEHYWVLALAAVPFLLHLLAVAVWGSRAAKEEQR